MDEERKLWRFYCGHRRENNVSIRRNVTYLASRKEKSVLPKEIERKAEEGISSCRVVHQIVKIYSFGFVLDVGCGEKKDGHIGIDLKRHPEVDIIADATAMPFREMTFDSVVTNHVLEHISKYGRALKEMRRITRSLVIISIPRKEHSYVHHEHLVHLSKEEWEKTLRYLGFDIEHYFRVDVSYVFVCSRWPLFPVKSGSNSTSLQGSLSASKKR